MAGDGAQVVMATNRAKVDNANTHATLCLLNIIFPLLVNALLPFYVSPPQLSTADRICPCLAEEVLDTATTEADAEPTPLTREGISDYLIQGKSGEILSRIGENAKEPLM
jgi:hypothetical protein